MNVKKGEFDPMTDVPTTEEEVMIALQRSDEEIARSLQGIYRAKRGKGKELFDAYRETLELHIQVCREARGELEDD